MNIGSFGDIVFTVSNSTLRTFDELIHSVAARIAVHEVVGGQPRTEFLGPGQGEITFRMQFTSRLGTNPREEVERFHSMIREGLHAPLIIGGSPVGEGDWIVEDSESEYRYFGGDGEAQYAELQVTLKEYH